jgi:transposase
MDGKFTIRQFHSRFPTDEACLEEIKQLKYGDSLECPKCHKENKFYKIKDRMAYSCAYCRHQIYPLKDTIFEKSTTPLRDWMYAIYLMAQTRAGISAKQLERELGCTYKTAWRIFHQIRKLMADDGDMLSGQVEVDETYFQPDRKKRSTAKLSRSKKSGEAILAFVQRDGKATAMYITETTTKYLFPKIETNVSKGSVIYTDDAMTYQSLRKIGYLHYKTRHGMNEYVDGENHTQNIENFFSTMKRGVKGVYRHVDAKYLQAYADEYAFRYSNRKNPRMFDLILRRVV